MLGDRAVGICDSPSGLCRRVAAALGRDPDELWFDYFGLNHLGWLRGVHDGERDLLPRPARRRRARSTTFEEGRLFGGEWLRSLGMIPNEYLYYFYYAADTVDAIRQRSSRAARSCSSSSARSTRERAHARRGARARGARRATTASAPTWPRRATPPGRRATSTRARTSAATRARRWRSLEAIALNSRRVLILNTANRCALPFLDERAVVEVPCVVGRAGPVPIAIGEVPGARARADRDDEGRRAHDDRRGAARARASWRSRRSRCTRSCRRSTPRAGSSTATRAPPDSRRRFRVTVDVVCAGPGFLDLTFDGLDALPETGGGALASDCSAPPAARRSPPSAPRGSAWRPRSSRRSAATLAGRRCARLLEARGRRAARAPSRAHAGDGRAAARGRARDDDLRAATPRRRPTRRGGLQPRAVVANASPGSTSSRRRRHGYATVGDAEAGRFARECRPTLGRAARCS